MSNSFHSQLQASAHSSQPRSTSDHPLLRRFIADQIAAAPQQRITFADYMDLALYHPEYGYYATGTVNIGSEGDFFTSPHLGNDFGELLAEQLAEVWEILGHPTRYTLVEMGAGRGLLAADILSYLHQHYPECFATLDYIIVEKAAGLISQQQQILQQLNPATSLPVRWCALEEIPENSITGCCFSNELVDAFPVHQFMLEQGQLREIYVTTASSTGDEINFAEVTDIPSTPQLNDYFQFVGIDLLSGAYPQGYRGEVNLAALGWLSAVAKRLRQGFLLTIDYGYTADRYYLPVRDHGTLQCYWQHRYHNDPYINIGHQDITAHVNFTALERQGELCGLSKVGFTQQGLFLMALGLGNRLAALSSDQAGGQTIATAKDVMRIMRRRQALHELMNPMGLGGFGVLIQSKGLTDEEKQHSLQGLSMPPL